MKLGVVGLPNVGKSTLFNSITKANAQSANYPFCTIEPNVGVVSVPDKRLNVLADIYNCKNIVPAYIEFVDIAGLVKGASKGEGLGNKFLSHIREVDAIVHVVRCFVDDNVVHVDGKVDPMEDVATINTELLLADIETAQKRLDKAKKSAKSGDKDLLFQVEFFGRVLDHLNEFNPARSLELSPKEEPLLKDMFLLTSKPIIYVANVSEDDITKTVDEIPLIKNLKEMAVNEKSQILTVSAKIEEDLSTLDEDEKAEFLAEMGVNESGLEKLIVASYDLLGLISFLTAGEKETRAWTINKGTCAKSAAGKIHSDFEKGFIRAEIIGYETFMKYKSVPLAKDAGEYRLEGKEYIVKDGDIIVFRFNV